MNREDHNTPQHTPTPWNVLTYDGDSRVWVCIEGNDLDGIAIDGPDKFRSVELAERIVRAVNRDHAFEPMREALKALADAYDADDLRAMREATTAARAALALAEEK